MRDAFPGILLNGPDPIAEPERRLPNNLNVSLAGAAGDALLAALGSDICVSTSSACTSASGEASHVLTAIGRQEGLTNLRISVGRPTTDAEIDQVIACIERAAVRA